MTRSCCVINCNSRSHDHRRRRITPDIHFYRFPAWKRNSTSHVSDVTKRRRMAWIAAVRRPNITFDHTPPHMEVCSKHFHKGKPAYEMLECDPDWAPSLNLGHSEVKAAGTDRFERLGRRVTRCQEEAVTGEKESAEQASNSLPPPPDNTSHDADDVTPLYYSDNTAPTAETEAGTSGVVAQDGRAQLESTGAQQEYSECCLHLQEIVRLREENGMLKEELSKKSLDENFLRDNDCKVKYYTGLPSFALLMGVLMEIHPSLPKTDRKLSHFQILLLTLMRLRLDLPLDHIAHIFDISRQTTSTLFSDTINVLYSHLSPLVHWPERRFIQASMPHQFVEMFGNRETTKSTGKSRNLFQLQSDKRITENSGFLQKLSPGDLVLADRGFDVKESVALVGATLKMPAFTRGRSQLDAKDVEETRKLAHVRIHVERVIGCMRSKYTFLNDTIRLGLVVPLEGEDMTLLDKIVAVTCALINMCPSVVMKPTF
ncbi:hypothetical protein N1851_026621 [Merluccius polli]|uniref:THAP-type domain-containing protein n=1 Tax=Merluccius polli TaxID=89951 RepID=A0AA47MBH1_MERPO|nr:hypothetical protein N1851_026621 [Merluccius polli]